MADALLAGLPRIVRAAEEVRLRGLLALTLAFAAAAWWTTQWLLDQPVEEGRTWLVALVVAVLSALSVAVNVPRRVRDGLRETRRPTHRVVYETRADGKERRTMLSGAVFLTAMVVLLVDSLAGWGGIVAGVIMGVAVPVGLGDLWEERRWESAERERDAALYLRVGPKAFVAGYGPADVYEVTHPPPEPPLAD